MFRNKKIEIFGMDHMGIVYANETVFGYLPAVELSSGWEREWHDIQGVALGVGWIAIVND